MLIDTHAHLDMYDDPKRVVEESFEAGVEKIIVPGVEPATVDKIINLAENFDNVYGALGVHPQEAQKFSDNEAKRMIELLMHPKIVAIGEIGLDYYWDKTYVDVQKHVFINQIEIAKSLNLPILIHDRDAHGDTFEILKNAKYDKVLMHCFSGSKEFAFECIKQGWMIALGGVVTFKNAKKVKEVARDVPLEYLVLETDSPFLTPHPFRGDKNSPKFLPFVAKEIANLKDTSFEQVAKITTQNALKFYNLDKQEN